MQYNIILYNIIFLTCLCTEVTGACIAEAIERSSNFVSDSKRERSSSREDILDSERSYRPVMCDNCFFNISVSLLSLPSAYQIKISKQKKL